MQKSAYIGLGLVVAVLLALPFVLPNSYYMDLAIRMAINAIIVIGLNLLIGFAGQISLGHAGFLGIGPMPRRCCRRISAGIRCWRWALARRPPA